MKHFLAAIALIVASAIGARASVYTWSRYNLTFEVPDHGFVTYNSATRFEIQWDEMVVTIQLYNKDQSDDKTLRANLDRKALGYNMYDTRHGKAKVKGFKTLTLHGTMPDGSRAVIADLVSKEQNLIVEVTVNYLYGNLETADDIVKSFTQGDKSQSKRGKKRQRVQSKQDAEKQKKNSPPAPKQQPRRNDGPLYDA